MTHPRETRGSHVQHSWKCDRKPAIFETVRSDATGRKHVVTQCSGCGGSDLTWRLRTAKHGDDAVTDEPPDAAA